MSTSSKARIDSIVTEPFDPVYEPWVDDEDEHTSGNAAAQNPHLHEPGFDPSYPFSPFQNSPEIGISAAPGWDAAPEGRFFESPEHSPQLRPTATAIASSFEYPNDMVSPLSPPATFPSSTLRHANQEMQPLKQESQDLREASVAPYDRPYRNESQSKRESAYTIPEAPPPPLPMDVNPTEYERERAEALGRDSLPMDVDLTDYERERAEALGGDSEGQQNRQSPGVRRHGSIAQRLGSRLMGTVRRNRTSGGRWSAAGRRSRVGDLGATDGAPDYMELDEREEAIGVDISTFGPEFAAPLPQAAVRAMEQHGFDDELAYTGRHRNYCD